MGNGGGFRRVRRSSRRRKRPRRGHIHRQIEEVCSGDLFGPGRRGRDVGDGQRRGVRRQDDVVRGVFVDGRERIPFDGQLLGCRLDDKVRVGDGPLEVRPGVDPREHLLPRFVELALPASFLEAPLGRLVAVGLGISVDVVRPDIVAVRMTTSVCRGSCFRHQVPPRVRQSSYSLEHSGGQ